MAEDAELRLRLTGMGVDVGPITGSTRALYKRMLRKRQNELRASAVGSAAKSQSQHLPRRLPHHPQLEYLNQGPLLLLLLRNMADLGNYKENLAIKWAWVQDQLLSFAQL